MMLTPDQVCELLAIGVQRGTERPHAEAGFFDAGHIREMAIEALELTKHARGVYFTMNPLRPDILARRCNRVDWAGEGELAKDKDVLVRRWLLVDADPVRDPLVSATDIEKDAALNCMAAVYEFLRDRGWPEPIMADSGNGYHLLYRVDLPVDDGGLVSRVLQELARRFDTIGAKIDQVVHNPARLCKVPWTWACKGDPTPDRPHRQAQVMSEISEIMPVPPELLAELAGQAPAKTPVPPASALPGKVNQSRLLVERWLTDIGVEFRVKPEPDDRGRTVYVLRQCPFDPSHTDPDACIMQDALGKLSAHCFHASCDGHGWQGFKTALGKPEAHHYNPPLRQGWHGHAGTRVRGASASTATPADSDPAVDGALLCISTDNRQLRDITGDALTALISVNNPPAIFQRAGSLTRLRYDPRTGVPVLEIVSENALRGTLARAANWVLLRKIKEEDVTINVPPPVEVVKDLASLPSWPCIPVVEAVVASPVFTCGGQLVVEAGYNSEARIWYAPAPELSAINVPPVPSHEEIALARNLLLVELLGDFPFKDEASRAHALAALLLPFVRPLIDGPTPLHLFDAPVEGTGKTLLAEQLHYIATGRCADCISGVDSEAEWRKRITATLMAGPSMIVLDNLNQTVDSGALASALTSRVWQDRLLQYSRTVRLPNTAVWLGTGNNTQMSREMIRRTLWSRLDAVVDNPWERTGFRHPHLVRWVKEHRGQLVWAALTLCQAWIADGRPAGRQTLGMFEAWAEVMGGILDVAGVPGLLANAASIRAIRVDQVSEWRSFVRAWWDVHGEQTVGVYMLYQLAIREKSLDEVLGDKGEQSQRVRLGKALTKAVDRIYGGYRIEYAGEDNKQRQLYRLCRPETVPAAQVQSPAQAT